MTTRRERERREERYSDAKNRAEQHDKGRESTALNWPSGFKRFKFTEVKTYSLDHLPYYAGAENPFCDKDVLTYERTYYTHGVETPTGFRTYCCPAQITERAHMKDTSIKLRPCAFCEHVYKLRKEGASKEVVKGWDWKEHQLFNLIDLDNKAAGVQIFPFNWFQYGKLLDDKMKKMNMFAGFYRRKGGFTALVSVEAGTYKGNTNYKPVSIDFIPREDYPEEIYDKVADLDAMVKEISYEEQLEILKGKEPEEEHAPEPERERVPERIIVQEDIRNGATEAYKEEQKARSKKEEAPTPKGGVSPTTTKSGHKLNSFVMHKKLGECKILGISRDGTKVTLEDEDGDPFENIDESELKKVPVADEEDDEPTPGGKGKKVVSRGPVLEEDEEDDRDEDEDDDDDD